MSSKPFSFADWLAEGGDTGVKSFALAKSYERMAWVYACVNVISTTASGAPLAFFQGNPSDSRNKIDDLEHPVHQLFHPPKEPDVPSFKELLYRTFVHLGISGIVFWVFTRKKGSFVDVETKVNLQPILSKGTYGVLRGWAEQTPEGIKTYTKDQVLPIRYYNPANPLGGLSPLSAARLSLETEFQISAWNSSFFKTGMKNPILLKSKGNMTTEQKRDLRKEVVNYYSGIEGGHGALLLQGGIDAETLNISPKDIDFIQGKKLNREEITAIYGVPPALVGIFEYANYSNVREQRRLFWENTLLPKMDAIVDLIQINILNREFPGIYARWDTSNIAGLKADPVEVAEAAERYHNMGIAMKDIAIILHMPELDVELKDRGDSEADGGSQDPDKPQDTDQAQDEGQQGSPNNEDFIAALLKHGSDIADSDTDCVLSSVEEFTNELRESLSSRAKSHSDLWCNLWGELLTKDLMQVASNAVRSALTDAASVEAGKLVVVSDANQYLSHDQYKHCMDTAHRYVESTETVPRHAIQVYHKTGDLNSVPLFSEYKNIALTLASGIRETVRSKVFDFLGVSALRWVSRDEKHAEFDGMTAEVGRQTFRGLQHPHHKENGFENIYRCSCTTLPVKFPPLQRVGSRH